MSHATHSVRPTEWKKFWVWSSSYKTRTVLFEGWQERKTRRGGLNIKATMNNAEQKLELKLVLRIKIHAFRCDLSGKFPLRDSVEVPWSVFKTL